MKKLLIILLVWPSLMMAQFDHEIYLDLSADPNKAFGVFDNPRTEVDHRGVDFDFELGIHVRKIGVYWFYGRFEAAKYQNYGFGADYYILDRDRVDIAAGLAFSRIMRKLPSGPYWGKETWADLSDYFNYHARIQGVYWIWDNVGVSGRFQYHRRPDIEVHGIFEGAIGVRWKFDREI